MGNEHTGSRSSGAAGTPFGWWPSPVSAAAVAGAKISRGGLHTDGTSFCWVEGRPQEGGRQVVVIDDGGAPPVELTPPGVSVRSRVHEYGGGAAATTADHHDYVDQADQRLVRLDRRHPGPPLPLTPPSHPAGSVRYADTCPTPSGRWLLAVEERLAHGTTTHALVGVATDGSLRTRVVVDAGDFVMAPRVSPDGRHLAWVRWDHPDMPWDRSSIWVAELEDGDDLRIGAPVRLAGGGGSSVGQPRWTAAGDLLFVDDRTGWWLPYRVAAAGLGTPDPDLRPLVEVDGELHAPDWSLGQSTLAEAPDGSVVARLHRQGRDHLVRLVPPEAGAGPGWTWAIIDQPCVAIAGVAVAEESGRLAVLGSTPAAASVVVELDLGAGPAAGPPRYLSTPVPGADGVAVAVAAGRPFVAGTPAGPVPGLVYEPTGAGVSGPPGQLPPLVVFCHGGPTGAGDPGYNPVIQFFTGRGLAVASVDYRGSSGYGRAYRQRLQGGWGVADVEDCTAYAVALAEAGRVDGRRMAIRGTSAGGLTALGALVASDRFAGAASWYGVTDLESLAADTHDFESRYLDGLVGPLPGARATYRERSPLHHADRITGSVLLLQGADDPIVPLSQAEGFAAALAANRVPCTLQVFAGESHGFRRAETVAACLTAELAFYRSLFGDGSAPPRPDGAAGPGAG